MNISKINPLGYEAKTEKGNTYKKSNAAATIGLATMAAADSLPYIFKNNAKVKNAAQIFSMGEALVSLFPKLPVKYIKPLKGLGIAIDLWVGLETGRWIDKKINKKRAAKADAAAEALNTNA